MPDDESLQIGLDLCKGRECLPCFTTIGDFVKVSRQPGFDPSQSMVMMASAIGACRFGQYSVLHRNLLDELGLHEVQLMIPEAANSYSDLGDNPTKLRQLAWEGIVAIDLLHKLLHQNRPYEITPGQTDATYQQCLDKVIAATDAGGGKHLVKALEWTAQQFEALPVDTSQSRPIIGLVGEIYLRLNSFGNQNLIRKVEAAGAEILTTSMIEWLYYTNWSYEKESWMLGKPLEALKTKVIDWYQQHAEHSLLKPVAHLLRFPHEATVAELMDNLAPYYHPALGNECVLSMGKAIDFAKLGLSGILTVMPFSCMPSIITAAMAPSIRADLDNIPWLDVIFDAQEGTNINTRLEAFLYQVFEFDKRRKVVASGH